MNLLARAMVVAVRGYQVFLSPLLGNNCRFIPSCSQYMIEAISIHGALRGVAMGLCRLLRCGPWCRGGYDPVPPAKLPR